MTDADLAATIDAAWENREALTPATHGHARDAVEAALDVQELVEFVGTDAAPEFLGFLRNDDGHLIKIPFCGCASEDECLE